MNHAELNQRHWDARSASYEGSLFGYFRFFQKRTLALLKLVPGKRFLDVGCGTGWAVRYAAGLVGPDGEASGIDLSSGMIARAEAIAADLPNVHFYQANAEAMPFEDDYFDALVCTQSFHHYPHPVKALEEMKRVLKPGGTVCVMDPTADSFIARRLDAQMKKQPDHVKLYSSAEFREMFRQAGLEPAGRRTILPIMKTHLARKRPAR